MQVNLEGYETIVIFGVESMVSYFKMLYINTISSVMSVYYYSQLDS